MEVDETESDSENVAEEDEEEYQMRYYGKSDSEGKLEYSYVNTVVYKEDDSSMEVQNIENSLLKEVIHLIHHYHQLN